MPVHQLEGFWLPRRVTVLMCLGRFVGEYRRCVARQEKNFLYITVLSTGFPLFDRVFLCELACGWCFVGSGLMRIVEILLFE